MKHITYLVIIICMAVFLVISYSRQQERMKKVLAENVRLANQVRDLKSLDDVNGNAVEQIQNRMEIQQRTEPKFVERRTYFRKNWQQFIAVSTSDYHTGFLGGIKDLQIIVRNQTEYPLDNVVVSVAYMRGNGDVFKTEQYTINNVPAKGKQSVNASASRKGQKVQLKLISITSQPMNFCWSVNKPVPSGNDDPYQCNAD
jgi:hypothetical protein